MGDPHELSQAYINAIELLEDVEAGKATELKALQTRCAKCERERKHARVIARFYEAPDDETGQVRVWVRVPPFKDATGTTPAKAGPVAWWPGELAVTLHAQCPTCRSWWLVFPGGKTEQELREMVGKYVARSHRPNTSASEPVAVGDATVSGTITDDRLLVPIADMRLSIDGAMQGGSKQITVSMVRVQDAAWGTVSPDTP